MDKENVDPDLLRARLARLQRLEGRAGAWAGEPDLPDWGQGQQLLEAPPAAAANPPSPAASPAGALLPSPSAAPAAAATPSLPAASPAGAHAPASPAASAASPVGAREQPARVQLSVVVELAAQDDLRRYMREVVAEAVANAVAATLPANLLGSATTSAAAAASGGSGGATTSSGTGGSGSGGWFRPSQSSPIVVDDDSTDDELPDVPGLVIGAPAGPPNPEAWAALKRKRGMEAGEARAQLQSLLTPSPRRAPLQPLRRSFYHQAQQQQPQQPQQQVLQLQQQAQQQAGQVDADPHNGNCRICFIRRPDSILACSHVFCSFCLGEWKKAAGTCPLCRKRFRKWKPLH